MLIHANHIDLAYDEAGAGPPVLFVHGYPLSRRMWRPQLDGLGGVCRLLAVDLRGHGDSQATPPPYTVDLLADDLNAFLDALGINHPVIINGLSMGGYVTLAFYRKYTARVARLILTSTRAGPDSPEARTKRNQSINVIETDGVAPIVDNMAVQLLAPVNRTQPALLQEVRTIMLQTSPQGAMGDLAAMRDRPDATPTLSEVHCPVLVVHGKDDQVVPPEEARKMFQGLQTTSPEAELQLVENAGHLPNLEQPDAYNAILRSFLRSHSW